MLFSERRNRLFFSLTLYKIEENTNLIKHKKTIERIYMITNQRSYRKKAMIIEAVTSFFGTLMPLVLLAAGLIIGIKLRFFYIFHPIKTFRLMFAKKHDGISPIRAASMALAGTLGVGNITGVTAAIAVGGAGAIFWMWCSAFVAMSVKYAETALAVRFRRKSSDGFYGGAPFYIVAGINGHLGARLGAVFAVLCIINSITVGNILQVNAAARSAELTLGVPCVITGIAAALLTAIIVSGGAKRISALTVKLIPIVSLLYIFMCTAVIFSHSELLGNVTHRIFAEAFDITSAAGGIGGFTVSRAVRYGVTRGVLTNEAGSGTSPTAHACADSASPMAQGCLGIFEVFADTIIICTFTAYAVLIGEEIGIPASEDAIDTVSELFYSIFGHWGDKLLVIVIFVFVFATLISQFYYGKTAIAFFKSKNALSLPYLLVFTASSAVGAVMLPKLMWQLSDLTVGIMTVINTVCILVMTRDVEDCTDITFGRGKLHRREQKCPKSASYCINSENASKTLH